MPSIFFRTTNITITMKKTFIVSIFLSFYIILQKRIKKNIYVCRRLTYLGCIFAGGKGNDY